MTAIRSQVHGCYVGAAVREEEHDRRLVLTNGRHTPQHIAFGPRFLKLWELLEGWDGH